MRSSPPFRWCKDASTLDSCSRAVSGSCSKRSSSLPPFVSYYPTSWVTGGKTSEMNLSRLLENLLNPSFPSTPRHVSTIFYSCFFPTLAEFQSSVGIGTRSFSGFWSWQRRSGSRAFCGTASGEFVRRVQRLEPWTMARTMVEYPFLHILRI